MRRFPLRVAPVSAGSFRATIGMPDPVVCSPGSGSSGPSMGGTDDIGNHEDDGAGTLIALPFSFRLYGSFYFSATVGANGVITLTGTHPTTGANAELPQGGLGALLLPLWSPLRTDLPKAGVFTALIGKPGSRAFVIEWRAAQESGGTANFAVTMYEGSTSFDFTYGKLDPIPTQYTIGVQQNLGAGARQYAYNGAPTIAPGLRLRFESNDDDDDYAVTEFQDAVFSNGSSAGNTTCPPNQSIRVSLRLQ